MGEKNLFTAYLLFFVGGFFGLHLIYLERDRQAVLYWMTFGGFFGLGWLYDLFHMRYYVAEANQETWFICHLANEMRKYPRPALTKMRNIVHMFAGQFFGYIVSYAIPYEMLDESLHNYIKLLIPFAVAIGVHLCGNIGHQQGKLIYPLIGAYLTFPFYLLGMEVIYLTSLLAVSGFDKYSKEWRRSPQRRLTKFQRFSLLFICAIICAFLIGSSIFFDCKIVSDDKELKCVDALKRFYISSIWKEFHELDIHVLQIARSWSWKEVQKNIIEAADSAEKRNALQVLGLDSSATELEIEDAYHNLYRKYYPKKYRDPAMRVIAEAKFIAVGEAFEVLSRVKVKKAA